MRDAARNIRKNPANYTIYRNGGKAFDYEAEPARVTASSVVLDADYLKSFGWLRVPRNIWTALQRYGAWIESSLVAEWTRLMKSYAAAQGRALNEGSVAAAMSWSDPGWDVAPPRKIALGMIDRGRPIHRV